MPGRERRRLVEEEQLGELAGLQERRAVPVLVDEAARDPALDLVAAADPPLRVVEAAAVPVDEPTRLRRDEVAERRDTVLEGHAPVVPATLGGRRHGAGLRKRCDQVSLRPPSQRSERFGGMRLTRIRITTVEPKYV